MRKGPAKQDAQPIAQLNRIRNEAETRKARLWWRDGFSAADYLRIEMELTNRESGAAEGSDYLNRGMVAPWGLHYTPGEEAFLGPEFLEEMLPFYRKLAPS